MKKNLIIGLLALGSLSAFASENILKYVPEGTYYGTDCEVRVQVFNSLGRKTIAVLVENRKNLATFNHSISAEMIQESAKAKTYSATVEVIPNDQYTGVRRYFLDITKDVYQAEVKIVEKRKFLGFWTKERAASCSISI